MGFDYTKFKPKTRYRRNGKAAYYDICRDILVPATPEESVRQGFVRYLTKKLGYPALLLETEVPLSHLKKGARGRADIVGYHFPKRSKEKKPLFIAECKAPDVLLTDDALEQCVGYDRQIGTPGHLFLTNGINTLFYSHRGRRHEPSSSLPSYKALLRNKGFREVPRVEAFRYTPPPFSKRTSRVAISMATDPGIGWIGVGSPKGHLGYLMNLNGLIQSDHDSPRLPLPLRYGRLLESGFRLTQFGNAAGGSWSGRYRYFLFKDKRRNHQILSVSLMGRVHGSEDPRFPNADGHTLLIVAIDDFDKKHISLQMDLDRFVREEGKKLSLWHDGTLTAGKGGKVKRADVVRFVGRKAPWLISNGEVFLGELPAHRYAKWTDAKDFLNRLMAYALIRDEFRRTR